MAVETGTPLSREQRGLELAQDYYGRISTKIEQLSRAGLVRISPTSIARVFAAGSLYEHAPDLNPDFYVDTAVGRYRFRPNNANRPVIQRAVHFEFYPEVQYDPEVHEDQGPHFGDMSEAFKVGYTGQLEMPGRVGGLRDMRQNVPLN
ncbi:MAG: hypothetical protein WBO77_01605, partial [Microgenomates group bacterium]